MLKFFFSQHFAEFFFSVFKGAPFRPFEHTVTFFRKMILIFNKKVRNFWPQGLEIAGFQQSFLQCWWKRPILEGSLIQKPT